MSACNHIPVLKCITTKTGNVHVT